VITRRIGRTGRPSRFRSRKPKRGQGNDIKGERFREGGMRPRNGSNSDIRKNRTLPGGVEKRGRQSEAWHKRKRLKFF